MSHVSNAAYALIMHSSILNAKIPFLIIFITLFPSAVSTSPEVYGYGLHGLNHIWISAHERVAPTAGTITKLNMDSPEFKGNYMSFMKIRWTWLSKIDSAISTAVTAHQSLLKSGHANRDSQTLVKAYLKRTEMKSPPANEVWIRKVLDGLLRARKTPHLFV